jgi:hypothetical protein
VAACRPSQIILKRENHESNLQGIPFRETVSRQNRFPQRAVSRFQIKDLGILHGRLRAQMPHRNAARDAGPLWVQAV